MSHHEAPGGQEMYSEDTEALNDKQLRALVLKLQGMKDIDVAAELGVHRTTIYRWKTEDPTFIAEYHRAQASLKEAAQVKLLQIRAKAFKTLEDALDHEDVGIRLRASAIILRQEEPRAAGPTSIKRAERQALLGKMV